MSETAQRAEPTAEDLRRRVEEIRQRNPSAETAGAPISTLQADDYFAEDRRWARCNVCGEGFTYLTIKGATVRRSTCDGCHEKQRATEGQAIARQAEERRETERKAREGRLLEMIRDAGANPWEHGAATLDNFDAGESGDLPVRYARRFVEEIRQAEGYDPVKGLYLHGTTGTGKTHIAVAVLREVLMDTRFHPGAIVYDHAAELVARIQATYGGNGDTFSLLERRFNAEVWILDDLGTERASDDVARHLTLIFTRRAMRPTLVTSNYSPAELDQQRPELMRVLSRLGPAYFRTAEVKGRDRRFG